MIRDIIQSAYHPTEISAMIKMKLSGAKRAGVELELDELAGNVSDIEFCYVALNKVSRSFAAVIRQLPDELRDPVCVFYLVLRGLDSIEDDTDLPDLEKLPLLRTFYTKNQQADWCIKGVGDSPDYRSLLAHYDKVARSFQGLDEKYQVIIIDICKKMGSGMADFTERPVKTVSDYDQYCHYVAGLVGIGLSKLFAVSGIENSLLSGELQLSNSMGLFLQKTNIVRDYHEDLHSGRSFWPKEVWGQYARNLEDFQYAPNSHKSLACLNHMIANALQHVPDSIEYLVQLRNMKVFRFCAIPQVMAIATLTKLYNNPAVFTGVVKIRKGLTAKMMMEINDLRTLSGYFDLFARDLFSRLDERDPNYQVMLERVFEIIRITSPKARKGKASNNNNLNVSFG